MKKKNIIKTLISLAVVMAGMIFLLFQYNNNQTVQSLEKQLIIKSIDKSSEKYCWSVDYKNKMKSKKDSGYNVYAYGKVKKTTQN